MKHEIQPYRPILKQTTNQHHDLFSQTHGHYGIFGLFKERSEEEKLGRKLGFVLGSLAGAYVLISVKPFKDLKFYQNMAKEYKNTIQLMGGRKPGKTCMI